MRITFCLNLPPPTSNPSFNSKPPLKFLCTVKDEGCWRRQCILRKMACVLIVLELGHLVTPAEKQIALALPPLPVPVVAAKWSERRICPSWRHKSLETVVPENLPSRRPVGDESVRSSSSKIAPPLSASAQI